MTCPLLKSNQKLPLTKKIDRETFAETHYGHMHKRLLHSIMHMREIYPTTRILIKKDDFKSDYRRQHLSSQAEIQLDNHINGKGTLYVLISLRIAFGGAERPSKYSTIAKPIADFGNTLLLDDTWEPRETKAPNQDSIPMPSTRDDSILFS